jgi:cell division protein ZapE
MQSSDYRQRIEALFCRNGRLPDLPQHQAMDRLANLAAALHRPKTTWAARFLPSRPPRGVFLWGGVGRGKTCLLDALIEALPAAVACRYHQHEFLDAFHRATAIVEASSNRFRAAVRHIVGQHRLLVLDEFHAYDPADAAILGRALAELHADGVTLALNANHLPGELWPKTAGHTLHVRHFTPLIDFIQQHCELIEVEGGRDYRLQADGQSPLRWWAPDDQAARLAARAWRERQDCTMEFDRLCRGHFKHTDYSAYCRTHPHLVLLGLPRFGACDGDALRRLIWLLDTAWECRLPLAITAATSLTATFSDIGQELQSLLGKDLRRTQSRLAGLCSQQ